MDEQGIVALITEDNEKEAVEDEIGVSKLSKCLFSHAEAMQKMDDYLAYYCCQPEATPEVKTHPIPAKKRESSVKQTSIFSFFLNKS